MRIGALIASMAVALACVGFPPASALDAIVLGNRISRIDFAPEHYRTDGNRVQVSTAPGADGIVRRIEVQALNQQGPTNWLVFALTNNTDDTIHRQLVIPHSDTSRVVMLTPSQGKRSALERTKIADVYPLRLDPGFTITYVAELSSNSVPEVALWEAGAYRKQDPSYKGAE